MPRIDSIDPKQESRKLRDDLRESMNKASSQHWRRVEPPQRPKSLDDFWSNLAILDSSGFVQGKT